MRRLLVPSSSLLALCWASSGLAQVAVEWQTTGTMTVGATDNVANTPDVPDDAPEGTPEPQGDGFGTLSPALSLTFETAAATQSLGFALGYSFYFIHPEANTFSASVGYGLRAPLSDTVEFVFGLSGSQTNLANFNLVTAAGATPVAPAEAGDNILVTAAVTQGLLAQLTETVSFNQGLGVQVGQTIVPEAEDQRTYVGSLVFGVGKEFLYDTLTTDVGTELQVTPFVELLTGVPSPLRAEVVHRASLAWQHQYSEEWSTILSAGAALAYDVADPQAPLLHPIGGAALNYASTYGAASLAYAHAVQPNILLRQITLNDSVTLQGQVFLGDSGLDLGVSTGYQGTRSFLEGDGFGPISGHTLLADAALGWVPGDNSVVRLELRYQFLKQLAGEPDGTGQALVPPLTRNAGLLSASFGFPDTPAAGGAAPFVVVPAPTANPDILAAGAPVSERGEDEAERGEERDRREDRERRGGSGTGSGGSGSGGSGE